MIDKTLTVINNVSSQWQYNLKLGKTYNTPLSIGFSDEYFELLTCVEHNLLGTGSISHGYDHNNEDETKGTSWVQPKKCIDCQSKIHFFAEKCICGSDKMEYIKDSRWGIDVEAHFKHNVKNYHLWILFPKEYSFNCKIFFLKEFVIDSKNSAFNEILKIQKERSESRTKNFLPFSSDFYASNPEETSSFTIVFDDVFDTVVYRNKVEKIIYNKEIIKKMSKLIEIDCLENKDIYLYEELASHINIRNKKTSHGKKRGVTTRRNQ